MKNTYIIFWVLLLLYVQNTYAQNSNAFSIKAGVGVSDFTATPFGEDGCYTYKLGASYEFRLNKTFGVEPSLFLTSKGGGYIRWKYLELPICGVAHVGKWSFFLGPYFSCGLSKYDEDIRESENRCDIGLDVGVRHHWNRLSLGMDFTHGFVNFMKEFDSKIRHFTIVLGYTI